MSSRALALRTLLSTIRPLPGGVLFYKGGKVQSGAISRSLMSVFSKRGSQNYDGLSLGPLMGVAALAASGIVIVHHFGKNEAEGAIKNGITLLPKVQASEKKTKEGPKHKVSLRERRYKMFASVVYQGEPYMTPRDFIESLIQDEPRSKSYIIL